MFMVLANIKPKDMIIISFIGLMTNMINMIGKSIWCLTSSKFWFDNGLTMLDTLHWWLNSPHDPILFYCSTRTPQFDSPTLKRDTVFDDICICTNEVHWLRTLAARPRVFFNIYIYISQAFINLNSRSSVWSRMILIIKFPVWYITMVEYFRRNKVYASWKLDKASISVNRRSHFQVHFVWQVWDGQLSPAFKSIRLKAFGGWKFDRGTTKLKPNMFTVGSSTSATFVLPVYVIRVHERLVVWNMAFFPYIGNVIIPADFHIFQRGGSTTDLGLLTRHWVLKRGWSDGGSRGRGGQAVHAMGDSSRKESKSCPSAKTTNRSLTHLKLPNIQKPNESNFQNHIPPIPSSGHGDWWRSRRSRRGSRECGRGRPGSRGRDISRKMRKVIGV